MDDFFAEQQAWDERATKAQAAAAQAYNRLLLRAEQSNSGQAHTVARFLASTYNGHQYSFDLFELRGVDVAISDDMLVCLDALRWGRADLYALVPDGDSRLQSLCEDWGLNGTKDET